MVKLLFLTISLMEFLVTPAQNNLYKGYIVTEKDTIRGEIVKQPYSILSQEIQFKSAQDSVFRNLSSIDIKGYCILPDSYFEPIQCTITKKRQKTNQIRFALKEVAGENDFLVLYLPGETERYFIRNKEFGLTELSNTKKIQNSRIVNFEEYKITLGKYLFKKTGYQKKIEQCSFHFKNLRQLISDYDSQFGATFSVTPVKSPIHWDFCIHGGFDNYLVGELLNNIPHNNYGLIYGISNGIYFDKRFLETELALDVNYVKAHSSGDSFSLIEIPLYLKYNNKNNVISPIFEAGIATSYITQMSKTNYLPPVFHLSDNLGIGYFYGLGMGLNYRRMHLKYVFYANYRNTLMIDFSLKSR